MRPFRAWLCFVRGPRNGLGAGSGHMASINERTVCWLILQEKSVTRHYLRPSACDLIPRAKIKAPVERVVL